MIKPSLLSTALLLAFAMPAAAGDMPAAEPEYSFADSIRSGKALTNFRLRSEQVQQDGKSQDAHALTLRSLVGWQSAPFHNISIGAQLINVAVLDDGYDNGDKGQTQAGRADFPRIVDPDYTGVNQLYVDWTGVRNTRVRLGRQSVKLDNVRFVGNVEFRQVMQVFDGVSVESKRLLPDTTVFAAHFDRVTQVSTLRQDTAISIVNARYGISPTENLIGYGYLVGWDAASLQATSTRTIGVRLDGIRPLNPDWKLLYTAEFAKQDPYKSGAANIDSYYARIGGGGQYGAWFARIDQEILSSNRGLSAFQTPLGTNHLFQGWTDLFLTTPNAGIRDTFITLGGKKGEVSLLAELHHIASDQAFATAGGGNGSHYGNEIDLAATWTRGPWMTRIEYARFREADVLSSGRKRDTDKLWLTAMYSF